MCICSTQHLFVRSCRLLVIFFFCQFVEKRSVAQVVVSGTSAMEKHFEVLQGTASLGFNDLRSSTLSGSSYTEGSPSPRRRSCRVCRSQLNSPPKLPSKPMMHRFSELVLTRTIALHSFKACCVSWSHFLFIHFCGQTCSIASKPGIGIVCTKMHRVRWCLIDRRV